MAEIQSENTAGGLYKPRPSGDDMVEICSTSKPDSDPNLSSDSLRNFTGMKTK